MAGPLQVGDIATLAKLAWDVYQYGFTDEHNASKSLSLFLVRTPSIVSSPAAAAAAASWTIHGHGRPPNRAVALAPPP